jgi:hypothetical protein
VPHRMTLSEGPHTIMVSSLMNGQPWRLGLSTYSNTNDVGGPLGHNEGVGRAPAPRLCQGQPERGCGGRTPGCIASIIRQRGGHGVPMAQKHPRHYHRAVDEESPATSDRGLYSGPPRPPRQPQRWEIEGLSRSSRHGNDFLTERLFDLLPPGSDEYPIRSSNVPTTSPMG